MPIPAPASTSLSQWRLFSCRLKAVAVATVYPPILYNGLRVRPYSRCMMVAAMKAVAVCPEGNELFFEPSGRSRLIVYFMLLTVAAMIVAEKAFDTIIRGHELRLSTPPSFIP